MRVFSSIWTLPDNPMDASEWLDFDQSTWPMVVKPDLTADTSVSALVHGKFSYFHDVSKKVVEDAQLSWECRRWLTGDEPPWPGANVKHGCLVWDLVDKSGWNTGTSFGGDVFSGLVHAVTDINVSEGDQTLSDTTRTLPDPNMPAEYSEPGWKGTLPAVPGCIFYDTDHGGIQTATWSHSPATDVAVVAGGHSMPGVNELIEQAILAVGAFASTIPGVPDLGPLANAILSPLYTDVFLAYGKWKDPVRATRLSTKGFHYNEMFSDSADAAYTLAWLISMRTGMWKSRETVNIKIEIQDGASGYVIGQNGHGHFFLGDRIGATMKGLRPGRIFVERVQQLTLSWSRTESPNWKIECGQRDPEDPLVKGYEQMQDMLTAIHELGVV